jgi:hypothetical protein
MSGLTWPRDPRVGELAAAAACLLAQAAGEMESGRMGGIPNAKGGALIAALVELQHATAGELDFAYLARTRAVRTLQERCGHEVSAETVNELVEAVLEITGNVIRRQLN